MKRYFLFGELLCKDYNNNDIDTLKANALNANVSSYGDIICYDPECMNITELLEFASNWGEFVEVDSEIYNDLSEFWLKNYC